METTIKKKAIGLCLLMILLLACTKSAEDTDELGEEKGYATGKVLDGAGNPIPGARIVLDNTILYASYIHGTTDKNGIYKVKAQPGAWRTFAYVDKKYNGQKYAMELFPDKTDAYNEEGAVRNFTWKLEGIMPWEAGGHYGGTVMLTHDIGFYEEEENIKLTLTPDGPLIDGTSGRTLTLGYGDDKWEHRNELWDIPIGRYKVTAKLNKDGKTIPLKIEDWYKREGLVAEFRLDFIPKPGNGVNNSASIVIGY